MKRNRKTAIPVVEEGSGNVYEDLGFKDAKLMLVKASLVHGLTTIFAKRRLGLGRAAKILNIDRAKLSDILNGHFSGVSTDRLIRYVNTLGHEVDIAISPKTAHQRAGKSRASAA
jgi:predicted XRE-type DNA-binding protein